MLRSSLALPMRFLLLQQLFFTVCSRRLTSQCLAMAHIPMPQAVPTHLAPPQPPAAIPSPTDVALAGDYLSNVQHRRSG